MRERAKKKKKQMFDSFRLECADYRNWLFSVGLVWENGEVRIRLKEGEGGGARS